MIKRLLLRYNNASIHKKLTISCWGAVIVPFLVLFTIISVVYVRATVNASRKQAQITIDKASDEINTWFLQNKEKLESIATDISVQKEMQEYPDLNYKEKLEFRDFIRNRLANVATSDKRVINIYVYINRSRKSFSNDFSDKDLDTYYSQADWFKDLLSGSKRQVLGETVSIQTGNEVLFTAIPIISVQNGAFLGFVYSELDYDNIIGTFYPLVRGTKNSVIVNGREIGPQGGEGREYMSVYSTVRALNEKVEYRISLQDIRAGYKLAFLYFALGTSGLMVSIYFTSRLFTNRFTDRIFHLRDTLLSVAGGNLDIHVKEGYEDEIGELSHSLNTMIHNMKQLINENYIAQIENQKATLRALQSQINPHFIYNTLESISMLALIQDNYEIVNLSKSFSAMMRYAMEVSMPEVLVRSEVENARNYIAIQRIRFGDCFTTEFDVEEGSEMCKMLRLSLQPLVENSFKHGFNDFEDQGYLKVSVRVRNQYLLIRVYNNGRHIDSDSMDRIGRLLVSEPEESPSECYAIRNLYRRLKIAYGEKSRLFIHSKEGVGTITTIQIPIQEEKLWNTK
ncbi:MAG: histidine kinase [Lacrimispora sp.]|uniref:sensor histidine kinase n=1 Tax=Lacrimispora sp. TaxID=2719234 RepID=UPI0039E31FA4